MFLRRRLRTLALVGCIAAGAMPRTGLAQEASAANVAAARRHFEKARAFYGQGEYRDAITELDAAHTLDPSAKDLVFNLGVVHEKLADIDEALKWFKLYTTMDLVPQERDRADAYIKRLEGAKREIEAKQAAPPQPPTDAAPPTQEGNAQAPPDQPNPRNPDNLVTPRDVTYPDLNNMTAQAFRESVLADVGFGAALVSGVATAYLYFGRSRTVSAAPARSTTLSAGPLAGGGALILKGSF